MPDNLDRRTPEDPTKIALGQSWEVEYWTKKLHVDAATLRRAVKAAGTSVEAVKKWLAGRK